ncbi:MAG: response regulator [Ruminococcus sp.]|nr:response regulator [Ruminococcus sp.]
MNEKGMGTFPAQDGCCMELIERLLKNNSNACILGQYCRERFPIFYASDRMLEMLGYKNFEEMRGHRGAEIINYIHPDDFKSAAEYIMGSNPHDGMDYAVSYRMRRKDGNYFNVADTGFVVEEGGCLFLISNLSDMSGLLRRQTTIEMENKALHQQNQELKYMKSRRPGAYHTCFDAEGFPFKEMSQQFCDLLGYSQAEIREIFDNKLVNLVVPEDRSKLNAVLDMTDIGSTKNIHFRVMTKDRDIIWVKGNVRLSEFGNERFYQATVVEITAEMKTQQVLKEKNHELELILSAIPGGLKHIDVDENYTYRFLSEKAAALFGYTVEEMLEISGGKAMEMVYHEDREYVRNQMEQCLANGNTDYSVRHRVKCKDGSLKYVLSCGRMAEDENETPYFQSLYIDITRETENEATIEQLQLIRALSNDYSDVFVLDLENDRISPVFQHEYSGITHLTNECYSEWIAQLNREFVHPKDQEEFLQKTNLSVVGEILKTREIYNHEYTNSKDGMISYWQIKYVRIGHIDNPVKAIIGFRNIDEEAQLNHSLQEALAQAQYANTAKTTFLNNMSHDIRTPMNAIIGFTALALTHIDNKERVYDYLRKISQSSNHLLSLINDVLDMSRIESGKMTLSEKPENLSEIMCEIRNIMQADIHAKQLNFDMNVFDATDENIYCDKLRINQIFLNLLSNAVKFTANGGTISVQVHQKKASQKGYAAYEFCVRDTGIGMENEFISHIFEPFAQERPSTLSGIQGTGLGMAITKKIVDMCDGTINVKSIPGAGTEIIVTLEFRLVSEHQEVETIKELEGVRALVVDDDMDTCQSVSRMLRQMGMRVEWTVCGKEAVVRANEAIEIGDAYKLYIIDWLMPDMNGIETARRIRRIADAHTPMILLSAYDCMDIEAEAKEAGINDFACKPLFLSELRRVLMHVCGITPDEAPLRRIDELVGKRVLVVEDTPLNQEISVDILEIAGISADIAENGLEALEMLQNRESDYYSMVFMDIQMPVMDGYEAAKRIRALHDPLLSRIPIIAMTANAYEEDKKKAFASGMNGHIGKPIDIPQLFEIVRTMIR